MKSSKGQILVEIILVSLIVIFVSLSVTQIISSSLKGVSKSMSQSPAVFLSREVAEAVRAVSKEDWHNISNLATSSANKYFPGITGGKWVTNGGTENVSLNSITYSRYFFIDDAYRSTSTGDIAASGGYYDPSTAKINIIVNWTDKDGAGQNFSQVLYIGRNLNNTYAQTDWSGGSAGEAVVTGATTTFATSSNIDYSTTTGSIQLTGQ
ncbi:MAG: hypothetical protein HYW34_03310 [Candidatus Brennerbacteria bacterium]|nr:hypothetical protein [Candidatus Brennerbacteria bacterium]